MIILLLDTTIRTLRISVLHTPGGEGVLTHQTINSSTAAGGKCENIQYDRASSIIPILYYKMMRLLLYKSFSANGDTKTEAQNTLTCFRQFGALEMSDDDKRRIEGALSFGIHVVMPATAPHLK